VRTYDVVQAETLKEEAKQAELAAATEVMLHEFDCDDLIPLAGSIVDLLTGLYRTRAPVVIQTRAMWVHELAQQLGVRHSVDIPAFRQQLIKKWVRDAADDGNHAARIAYLLLTGETRNAAEMLLNLALTNVRVFNLLLVTPLILIDAGQANAGTRPCSRTASRHAGCGLAAAAQ